MRHGRVGILGQGIAPDGLRVAIEERLAPGERTEHDEYRGAERGRAAEARRAGGSGERDQRHAGQVLKMVGHKRVAHRVDVHEPERGRERRGVAEDGDQRTVAEAPSPDIERGDRDNCADREEVLPPDARIDPPPRVDEGQRVRPEELRCVEPERAARDQAALDEREPPELAGRAHVVRLHPAGHDPGGRAEREEGQERHDVDPPAPPPEDQEQHHRQRAGDRLREERADEEADGRDVGGARAAGVAQVGKERAEVERAREHVLPLRDPGNRLDVHRMDREHGCREPCSGQCQAPADHPDEDCVEAVQEHIDEMVGEGLDPPEVMVEPEAREGERVVLRHGAGFEPDAPEPIERPQRRVGRDVRVVVPDEAGVERGKVRRHDEEPEGQRGGAAGDRAPTVCHHRRRLPLPPAPPGPRPLIR